MSRSDDQRIEDILEIAISLQILVEKGEEFFLADITHQWGIERALQMLLLKIERTEEYAFA